MAQPFVKILNDKLSLVGEVPKGNPRVISILGKARMGKSTFLNAIVSYLMKQSQAPFKAMDCDDHCTRGIDSYYIKDHNLLLLDSQGLDYEDASHDPHLLLFLYIVSDLIVFNDTRRLENGALKLMESVCTFTNYLDIDTVVKPKLYFRIFDSDVKDPQKNLEKVLGTYQDQYQSIRKSIKHLFDKDICLLKTEPLDRPAKLMLANNMYRELLNEPLGFKEAIEAVLTAAYSTKTKSILNKVSDVVENINNNKEISIEKLDVVTLQAENDIHKWIQETVPSIMYGDMTVDGTQKCFEEIVEPRKNAKKGILTAFTKRFKDVEESIRQPFYKSLSEKLDGPIQKAIDSSRAKAQEIVKAQYATARLPRECPQVNSCNRSFQTVPEDYWTNYLTPLNALETFMARVYEPVKKEIQSWIDEVREVLNTTVKSIREEEEAEKVAVRKLSAQMLVDMEVRMLDLIDGFVDKETVLETNDQITMKLKNLYLTEFENQVALLVPRRKLFFKMISEGKFVPVIEKISVNKNVKEYDLVKPIYDLFAEKVGIYVANKETPLRATITEQKEDFLYQKLLVNLSFTQFNAQNPGPRTVMESWTQRLIKNNPEIFFVEDNILHTHLNDGKYAGKQTCSQNIMTMDTYGDSVKLLYETVYSDLAKKGYCKEDLVESLEVVDTTYPNLIKITLPSGTIVDRTLKEVFIRKLQKVFCKKSMNGFELPQTFDHTQVFKKDKPVNEKEETKSGKCRACNKQISLDVVGCACIANMYCQECSVGHMIDCPGHS